MIENNYFISAPQGGSGHFLWFFLNQKVYDDTADSWRVDNIIETVNFKNQRKDYYVGQFIDSLTNENFKEVKGYVKNIESTFIDYILVLNKTFTHSYNDVNVECPIAIKNKIRIMPLSYSDYIPIAVNRIFKCGDDQRYRKELDPSIFTVELLDNCLITIQNWSLDNIHKESYNNLIKPVNDFNIIIGYDTIMSIDKLSELYCKINNVVSVPGYKISYANSYINKHVKFYNNPFYRCLYRISNFEYNNSLYYHTRTWSIDDLDFATYDSFLNENLKLEKYIN